MAGLQVFWSQGEGSMQLPQLEKQLESLALWMRCKWKEESHTAWTSLQVTVSFYVEFRGHFIFSQRSMETALHTYHPPCTSQMSTCSVEGGLSEEAEALIFWSEHHGLLFSYVAMKQVKGGQQSFRISVFFFGINCRHAYLNSWKYQHVANSEKKIFIVPSSLNNNSAGYRILSIRWWVDNQNVLYP